MTASDVPPPPPATATTWRRFFARTWLQTLMIVSIAVIFAAALWSSAIERRSAFQDFSREQTYIARTVAIDVEHDLAPRLRSAEGGTLTDAQVQEILADVERLEEPRALVILLARPNSSGFIAPDGRVVPSTRLRAALDRGEEMTTIPRDEAGAFGLPKRMAVAGLATVTPAGQQAWSIAVVASAERLRNREQHEQWRFGITALSVTVLVTAFGGLALRRQRHELELERRVAIGVLEREREALLGRADKMAALAALSTGIAHELGTPLGVIVGRVEQVMDDPTAGERSRGALAIVLEQVERIETIVRGCLALARGDAPNLVRTSPERITSRAVALVRHRFDQAHVTLAADVPADLPEVACAPSLFEHALVNVLLNACQATPPEGKVRLDVRAGEGQVHFTVEDEGEGVTDEVASRAGQPFFSTKRDQGGSGLGLTIAREIVSHHAGTLTLARREGRRGTRARISIPS